MKRIRILIFCIVGLSCSKNEDVEGVIITIDSPTNNSSFPATQRVPIKINLSAKDGLDVFHLRVVELNSSNVVLNWQQDARSSKTFQIDTALTIRSNTTYLLAIEAISEKVAILNINSVFSGM